MVGDTSLTQEQLEALPKKTPEGKDIVYYKSAGRGQGIRPFNVKTGKYGGSTFIEDISKEQRETLEFRTLPSPEVEAEIRRRKFAQGDDPELKAKREATGEAPPKSGSETWESYIEKWGTAAQIPNQYIARRYEKQLGRKAEEEGEGQGLRHTEILIRTAAKGKPKGEWIPRKALIGRVQVEPYIEPPRPPTDSFRGLDGIREQYEQGPTTPKEFQESLFKRMGYGYKEVIPSKFEGDTPLQFELYKKGRKKIVIGDVTKADIPVSAKFEPVYLGLGTGKVKTKLGKLKGEIILAAKETYKDITDWKLKIPTKIDFKTGAITERKELKDILPPFQLEFKDKPITVPKGITKFEKALKIKEEEGKFTPSQIYTGVKKAEQKYYETSLRTSKRLYETIRTKPEKIALTYGAGFGLGSLLKGAGGIISQMGVAKRYGKWFATLPALQQKALFKAPSYTLGGAYVGVTGYQVSKLPKEERFPEAVTRATTELVPFMAGMKTAGKFFEKVSGTELRLRAKTTRPPLFEKLVTKPRGKITPIVKTITEVILKFKYPRELKLVKAFGKKAPTVGLQKGELRKLGQKLKIIQTQVGRKPTGVIRGDVLDIYFKKEKRGIKLKYVAKTSKIIKDVWGRKDIRTGAVLKESMMPYKKEKLIPFKETVKTLKPKKKFLDIGIKEGEEGFFNVRRIQLIKEHKLVGREESFEGLRDVKRAIQARAKGELLQKDIATPQIETLSKKVLTAEGRKWKQFSKVARLPTIQYAFQPTYLPHQVKIGRFGKDIIRTHIGEPTLTSQRRLISDTAFSYIAKESRVKPLKAIAIMGKRGQLLPPTQRIKRGVKVQAPKPTIPERYLGIQREPLLTLPEAKDILYARPSMKPSIIPISRVTPISKVRSIIKPIVGIRPITRIKPEVKVKPITEIKSIVEIKPITRVKPIIKAIPKIRTEIRTEIKPIVEVRSIAKTLTRIVTKTITKVKPRVRPITRVSFTRVPPPIKLPFIPFIPKWTLGIEPKKKKKRKYAPTYKPSLVGKERYKLTGFTISKPPKFVSLGERPITKGMVQEMKRTFGGVV